MRKEKNTKNYIILIKFYVLCIISILLKCLYYKSRKVLFEKRRENGLLNIPIFIISYNRLSYLKNMISQLEKLNFTNINIIDNNSNFPQLIEYYKTCPYKIFFLESNDGHMAFWENEMFKTYRDDFYIVTDPDLEIVEECPDDFLDFFMKKLYKYPFLRKTGFSLRIHDLPKDGCIANDAYEWEKKFYDFYIKRENSYYAPIDTTFALYVPDTIAYTGKFLTAFRTGEPYQMRHLPWYKKADLITDEDMFYSVTKKNGWSDPVAGFKPDE